MCLQEPGKFNLTLVVMPSCWLGCNASASVAFSALKQTAAERAGKGPARGRDKNAPKFLDDDEVRLLEPDSSSRIRNRAFFFYLVLLGCVAVRTGAFLLCVLAGDCGCLRVVRCRSSAADDVPVTHVHASCMCPGSSSNSEVGFLSVSH